MNFARPDLVQFSRHSPIALNPPLSFFRPIDIPDVGELMLASFPLDGITNFRAWWMGEKYDGIRCCWNPIKKKVYSRNGHEIRLIPEVPHMLPAFFLDAEFWFGRGQFPFTYPMFKGSPDINWPQLRMVVFDTPAQSFERFPFEERFQFLLSNISLSHPFAFVVSRCLCKNKAHMRDAVKGVIENGGEGIIMRKVKSMYERGRTSSLLKIKAAVYDMEAIVVGIDEQNFVHLKLPNGKTFEVPPQEVAIPTPKVGDIVSFSSESQARRELPVGPKIFRVRTDVSWADVLRSYREQQHLNASSKMEGFTTQPIRHWTVAKMRNFMEKFARAKNMDPFLPSTWYNISYEELSSNPSGKSILAKFAGNYYKALRGIFPDMKLDATGFSRSLWSKSENRREFFEKFAAHHQFDPSESNNWHALDTEFLMDSKGASKVIAYHDYSPQKALLDLFPNIGLTASKFRIPELHEIGNRRKFFEDYAHTHGFEPLVPENWYSQTRDSILATKGAALVISYYHNSVKEALMSLFPDIGLVESKFETPSSSLWGTVSSRRKFFEKYAKDNRFDPYNPENWYDEPRQKIIERNGAYRVLFYHNNSVPKALIDLFPEINWDKSRLRISWYREVEARHEFFEEYARKHSFNSHDPEQWYKQPMERIIATKGARRVLAFYNNSLSAALRGVYPQMEIDSSKFGANESQWSKVENKRKFFENYAEENDFDPLTPEHWYSHPRNNILKRKGIASVLFYHNNSLSTALSDLFPEIGFSKAKYKQIRDLWGEEKKRRNFFEDYATHQSHDFRDPNFWYSQVIEHILAIPGARGVLAYHNNSIPQALMDLFPDIGLSPSKFDLTSQWKDIRIRRKFFDSYARTNQFDPRIPDNWYLQPVQKLMALQDIASVLSHHNNSIPKALADLYPEIGIDRRKFNLHTKWHSEENRREFFEMYAKENGFDPLVSKNWYLQDAAKIRTLKGSKRVLFYHNNSVPKAVFELFPGIGLSKRKLFATMGA
eukprot:Phypoly_transcript_01469.p1 GENE.Phypoly_transcript_01469~~Phypoly_transcript_01469.p1  ORF type:complete len:1107 (+),score=182.36 Phypoly_transcript_01469:326-3322(+)